jgi:hypothetical protein
VGYSVLVAALRTAASAARAAGEVAGAVDLGAAVRDIGVALPGTVAVHAAAELTTAWRDAIAGWQGGIIAHGEHLQDSADAYAAAEAQAVADLRRTGGVDVGERSNGYSDGGGG